MIGVRTVGGGPARGLLGVRPDSLRYGGPDGATWSSASDSLRTSSDFLRRRYYTEASISFLFLFS